MSSRWTCKRPGNSRACRHWHYRVATPDREPGTFPPARMTSPLSVSGPFCTRCNWESRWARGQPRTRAFDSAAQLAIQDPRPEGSHSQEEVQLMHKLRQFFLIIVVLYATCSANAQVKGSGTTDYVPLW